MGQWSISGLPAGNYNVAFYSYDDRAVPVRNWFPFASFRDDAEVVVLTELTPYDFGTIALDPRFISSVRVSGPDRFATAVALSQSLYLADSGPLVYIVNGFGFPDALSAGAAAAQGGVLLLVEKDRVPDVVKEELERLNPRGIVIVGGTGVVSNAVQSVLETYVDSPFVGAVSRIPGVDRYDTSRRVVDLFGSSMNSLFIATGRDFPDALSAVPATRLGPSALLLVDGAASALDAPTRDLIDSLNVPVYIIGGTGVVSASIATEMLGIAPAVFRVSGADRFDTSVEVALRFFAAADYAYLANGFSFPDALAAGPIAASNASPIYLSRKECVPEVVLQDVYDVLANKVIVVGGTGVLSPPIEAVFGC